MARERLLRLPLPRFALVKHLSRLAIYFLAQPSGPRSFDYATIYNALLSANRELGACADDMVTVPYSLVGSAG